MMRQTFRKFRAATFEEAYAQMVTAMGDQALVMNTAEIKEAGLRGLLGKTLIELTASLPVQAEVSDLKECTKRRPSLVEKRYLSQGISKGIPTGSEDTMNDTVAYFQKLVTDAQARIKRNTNTERTEVMPATATLAVGETDDWQPVTHTKTHAEASNSVLKKATDTVRALDERSKGATVVPFPQIPTHENLETMQHEIVAMRRMIEILVAENPTCGMPPEFVPHYRELLAAGMCREQAASLVGGIVRHCDMKVLQSNPRVFTERLKLEIQRLVSVTHGLRLEPGHRKVVALIGATGVGKTTNLAKIAALFAIQERMRVALITADTYRVGAPEQLRVYANIVSLPMMIANDAEETRMALDELTEFDLVLIDTAGSSPFNTEQTDELRSILAVARPDETLLVLNANTHVDELRTVLDGFRALKPTSLVFTKLDETRRYGAMVSIAAETGLPLSYFSTGQNVPDDIEVASPSKLAKLLLQPGGDRRGSSKQSS